MPCAASRRVIVELMFPVPPMNRIFIAANISPHPGRDASNVSSWSIRRRTAQVRRGRADDRSDTHATTRRLESTLLRFTRAGARLVAPASARREAITTHFQPIFSVRQKSVVGMEALSRGVAPRTAALIAPYDLFKMAAAEELPAELEDAVPADRGAELRGAARSRPDELLLFLNLDLGRDRAITTICRRRWRRWCARAGLLPRNVAVEFLEARLEDVGRFGALADGAAPARLPGRPRRRRRRALEPGSHPAVSPRRDQDRSQPDQRRGR